MLQAHALPVAAALGAELSESEATLRVFLTAGGLAILGCLLLLFTIWWWRGTKPESPVLGPLEVMGDRRWQRAGDGERRRLVDETRPAGALGAVAAAPEPIDLSVLARDLPSGFDDLRDPSRSAEVPVVSSEPLAPVAAAAVPEPVVAEPVAEQPKAPLVGDDTMYQVESPSIAALLNGSAHVDGHLDAHLDGADDEPSDELVIDPLLQRTASQD